MTKMLDQLRAQLETGGPQPPIARLIGWKLTEIEPGQAVFELAAEPRHTNSRGKVHGGVQATVAQVAMAAAYASTLADGETCTTVELKISFLRAGPQGRLLAKGRLVHQGRTLGIAECDLIDEEGRLVARASGTFMTFRDGRPAGARLPTAPPGPVAR